MNSFKEGAVKAGQDISIYLTGSMFSDEEKADIYAHLPEGCYFQSHNSDLARGDANTVFISFRASHDRAYERLETTEKFFDLLVKQLEEPAPEEEKGVMDKLYSICEDWADKESAEQLYRAFLQIDEADKYRSTAIRDRNVEKPSVPPHRPDKTPTWEGDPELQLLLESCAMNWTDFEGYMATPFK